MLRYEGGCERRRMKVPRGMRVTIDIKDDAGIGRWRILTDSVSLMGS